MLLATGATGLASCVAAAGWLFDIDMALNDIPAGDLTSGLVTSPPTTDAASVRRIPAAACLVVWTTAMASCGGCAHPDARGLAPDELRGVCQEHPARLGRLLAAVDPVRADLAEVRRARDAGNLPGACASLLDHFMAARPRAWLAVRPSGTPDRWRGRGDRVLAAMAETWPDADRRRRFLTSVHSAGYPLQTLLQAYVDTRDERYAEAAGRITREWILAFPPGTDRRSGGAWQEMSAGIRGRDAWPQVFFGFRGARSFPPDARLLLLASSLEHAEFLMRHHQIHHNMAMMELNGLLNLALCFPQFGDAERWFARAREGMLEEVRFDYYGDGAQKELTTTYHVSTLADAVRFATRCREAGRALPDNYRTTVERMHDYLARTIRPDGCGALNNDSVRMDVRHWIRDFASEYDRADWTYVATRGAEGVRPPGPPSRVLPWAGHCVMRSSWTDANAHWAFFDAGPWGMNSYHSHNDKLHLSVTAFGRDLLVDAGSGQYTFDARRRYYATSHGHNVILIDSRGQDDDVQTTSRPLGADARSVQDELDFFVASYGVGFRDLRWWENRPGGREGPPVLPRPPSPARHTRAVVYLRNRYWVVIDRVEIDRPRKVTALWHFHPDCAVRRTGQAVASVDANAGNLRIVPAAHFRWDIEIVKGRTEPTLQGWYAGRKRSGEPSPCAIYQAKRAETTTFAWVLYPARGEAPAVTARLLPAAEGVVRVEVREAERRPTQFVVRLGGFGPVPLGAGRTLRGRCTVLRPDAPVLAACGWVTDASGRTLAKDVPPLREHLRDWLRAVAFARARLDGNTARWTLDVHNPLYRTDLSLRLAPDLPSGVSWTTATGPEEATLRPGQTRSLAFSLRAGRAGLLLPLPVWRLRAEAGGDAAEATLAPNIDVDALLRTHRPSHVVPRADRAPRIDGNLDDPAWRRSPDATSFTDIDLSPVPAVRTAAWWAYDDRNFYVAFRCAEPLMDKLKTAVTERDGPLWTDDSVEVLLDTNRDRKTYLHVIAGPSGDVYDAKGYDKSFDAAVRAAGGREKGAWTIEVAIPLSDLGIGAPLPGRKWGFLLARTRAGVPPKLTPAQQEWQDRRKRTYYPWSDPTRSSPKQKQSKTGNTILQYPPTNGNNHRVAYFGDLSLGE